MKTALSVGLLVLSFASAQAQVFRPAAVNGAVLGGVAGAVIGHNSGDLRHNAWKGAALGAGAGLLVGQAIDNSRTSRINYDTGAYVAHAPGYSYGGYSPSVSIGYSRGYYSGHRYYGYRDRWSRGGSYWGGYVGPVYSSYPSYGYYDGYGADYPYYGSSGSYRTSGAANGLLLGALAGGVIGHNSGDFRHNGWRGAAWGAGLGWLLGTIADSRREAVTTYAAQPTVVQAPATAVSAVPVQPVTAPVVSSSASRASSPMSSANSLFGRN
jgi:uncharacterized protein YcfJ